MNEKYEIERTCGLIKHLSWCHSYTHVQLQTRGVIWRVGQSLSCKLASMREKG